MTTSEPRIPRFIQVHTLHAYPAALLNRDDAGMAKRLPYGSAVRTRVSSQSLKRHWRFPYPVARDADANEVHALQQAEPFSLQNLGVDMSVRTRYVGEEIARQLRDRGLDASKAAGAARGVLRAVFGGKDKPPKPEKSRKTGKSEEGTAAMSEAADADSTGLQTAQAVLFGRAELDYLVSRALSLSAEATSEESARDTVLKGLSARDEKANLAAMKLGSGLEAALFGRMVTSDLLAHRDAAVYVSHAFTVHAAQVENDYFTVVDDLGRERGESGGAGIFDTELASGLYYGYVVIDVPQLVANLEGIPVSRCFDGVTDPARRELAARVVHHFLHLVATVSPGAKRGSTAPFGYAQQMLIEAGDRQPRSLASAFHDPLPLSGTESLVTRAVTRLAAELASFDDAYGMTTTRRCLNRLDVQLPHADRGSLDSIATAAASWVREGAC